MKIALGTTSENKQRYLNQFLTEKEMKFSVNAYNVPSEINDQPLSEEETILGARNRARNAFAEETSDLGIGMEGGLEMIEGRYYFVCVTALFDGNIYYLGISGKLPLPKKVSDAVREGKKFGQEIRKYNEGYENGDMTFLVEELISREESFMQSLESAFIDYFQMSTL